MSFIGTMLPGGLWVGLHYLIAFVAALAVLVVVHELGHYLVARACGVKVLRFSFGFGPLLWVRRAGRDDTEWAVCAIPLGGYVKMLDENEGDVAPHDALRAFNRQPLTRRVLIVAAGPAANLLLAVVLFALVFAAGVQEFRPVLASPAEGSPAAQAGVPEGGLIQKLNGIDIISWQDVRWALTKEVLDREQIALEIRDPSHEVRQYFLDLPSALMEAPDKDGLALLGLRLVPLRIEPIVGKVMPASPAELAGLKVNDRIRAIDGVAMSTWDTVATLIRQSPEKLLRVEVWRESIELSLQITPQTVHVDGHDVGRMGISPLLPRMEDDPRVMIIKSSPVDALVKGARLTWETSVLTLRMMGRMVTGDISLKNISGPVTIADYAGQSAQMGVSAYLRFLALISISLGVLNLLPIPILDGGHLLYYLIEGISGRPLQERFLELAQRVGMLMLAMLMVFAFYNDFTRLISG